MKTRLAALGLLALLVWGVQARVSDAPPPASPAGAASAAVDLRGLAPGFAAGSGGPGEAPVPDPLAAPDLDVVDAHWMALTMWGEARSDGEAGMRAVGHVIDNRRRAGGRHGDFATETVTEAWQFSAWNRGDPNRAAMLDIDALSRGSREFQLWHQARAIAAEILSGRSADPTGGAMFYHTVDIQPAWSRGLAPDTRIGRHLFFRTAV